MQTLRRLGAGKRNLRNKNPPLVVTWGRMGGAPLRPGTVKYNICAFINFFNITTILMETW